MDSVGSFLQPCFKKVFYVRIAINSYKRGAGRIVIKVLPEPIPISKTSPFTVFKCSPKSAKICSFNGANNFLVVSANWASPPAKIRLYQLEVMRILLAFSKITATITAITATPHMNETDAILHVLSRNHVNGHLIKDVVPRSTGNTNSGTRELTLKCKFKCYIKPMNNPLGVSPSKGEQGATRGKEKFFWPRWESNPRPPD